MTLGTSLATVIFAFVAILAGVMVMAFRERRLARVAVADSADAQRSVRETPAKRRSA